MAKILISGGSGLLGSNLTKILKNQGHQVAWLTRNPKKGEIEQYFWNPQNKEIDPKALHQIDTIIHLAGAGVADKRWTSSYKNLILQSRMEGTQTLYHALQNIPNQVKTFIGASAVGIYGTHPNGVATENAPLANNFLADVCKQWENETQKIANLGIRTAIVRIGIVLSKEGGFVKEISQLAKYWLAAPLGYGHLLTPWIHINDLSQIFIHLMQNPGLSGVFNGVAPNPATNKALTKAICEAMHKPFFLPAVPAFVLQILVGQMAPMLLSNQDISCQKIQETGFQFQFTNHQLAIQNLFLA